MTVLADIGVGPISIPTPGDVATALKNAVLDVADAVFDKIIEWIAGLLAEAVTNVTEALVTLLSAIKPTLTPGGAIEDAAPIQQSVLGLAASLVALFFVFRLIHGLITGQAGQNLRATVVDLPMVIVGTLFFGFLCYTLLTIVDQFSDPLIDNYASTLSTTVGELYSQDGIVQGGVFVIIFALLYIVAAVFLCFELFVRSSLIYLVVMFAPLAIATRIWGPTRSYARRATETAVALIFSKLAIAVTLATGASLMSGADESGGNVAMIQGSAILLLAAFMPFGLMRVIPMMEGAVAGEGVARTMGMKAAGGAVVAGGASQLASKPINSAARRVRGRSGSGGGASTSDGFDTGGDAPPPTGGPGGGASGNPPSGDPKPTPNGPGGSRASNPATTRAEPLSATATGTTGGSEPREVSTPAPSSHAPTPAASGSTSATSGSTRSPSDASVAPTGTTASATMSGASTGATPPPVVSTAESSGTSPVPPSESAEAPSPGPVVRVVSRPPILTPSQRAAVAKRIGNDASEVATPAKHTSQASTALRTPPTVATASPSPTSTSGSAQPSAPLAKSRTIARPPLSRTTNEDNQ
jgi:type IV secretion system protein TrbL